MTGGRGELWRAHTDGLGNRPCSTSSSIFLTAAGPLSSTSATVDIRHRKTRATSRASLRNRCQRRRHPPVVWLSSSQRLKSAVAMPGVISAT